MHVDLHDLLACPRCGPSAPLVMRVDAVDGDRVREGELGCPACDARFPIAGGVLRLGAPVGARAPADEPARLELEVAALLGADSARGVLLLDEGLASVAGGVARLAPRAVVLALVPAGPGAESPRPEEDGEPGAGGGASRIEGAGEEPLPLVGGRLAGVALLGGGGSRLREAARILRPGGRLAVLRPAPGVREALSGLPFEVLAAEDRAVVASRR